MNQHLIDYYSNMPEMREDGDVAFLSSEEDRILHVVKNRWPTSSLEIAEFLGHSFSTREEKRILSSRIVYHIKKLVQKKHLMSKRFGNALVVWPYEVESLRIMHETKYLSLHPKRSR
ncbi:MAG: hypothetical protein V1776_00880 [Candidatus Diapherotrites archaeon]